MAHTPVVKRRESRKLKRLPAFCTGCHASKTIKTTGESQIRFLSHRRRKSKQIARPQANPLDLPVASLLWDAEKIGLANREDTLG